MRVTPKQYALSLYESLDGKPASQVKQAIKNFVELLAKQGRLGEEEKIIKEFGKIWDEKYGVQEALVVSARELDKELVKLLKSYIANLSGAKAVAVEEKIDKNILGGVVIKYGDRVLDGSLKTALEELREKMAQ